MAGRKKSTTTTTRANTRSKSKPTQDKTQKASNKNTKSTNINPKAKKKSTKGQKNWRKNIDISELEKKNLQKDQDNLVERDVGFLKDEDLFVVDNLPNKSLKNEFLGKKTKKDKKVKKLSIVEERKIQRIKMNLIKEQVQEKTEIKKEEKLINLWDDEGENTKKPTLKFPKTSPAAVVKFPTLPIPHPGQSYNPSKQDITSLLHKIVDLHKKPEADAQPTNDIKKFEESDNEEEVYDKEKFKVANNPAVDDFTQRKSKTEKKQNIQKKLNRIKEKDLLQKKENKIKLANEKSLKRIEKEQDAQLKELEEKKKEEQKKIDEHKELIRSGFIEE
jgi:nucleolar protein 53